MINHIYQLIAPHLISVKFQRIQNGEHVLVRPKYMAICHADQRYFLGMRDPKILKSKLPMALIHECWGEVLEDKTGTFASGQKVVLIPNIKISKNRVVYENYDKNSYFLSSGHDGFMREIVDLPSDRMVAFTGIEDKVAAIGEFVSVAVHAVKRFSVGAHPCRQRIGIWGDGSLAYAVTCVLSVFFPTTDLYVIGRNESKLAQFSFVKETYLVDELPKDFEIDHAFECCGGEGSYYAIADVIHYINPQGVLVLMGVSENEIAVNTRNVLEKGLIMIGCSRSGKEDFEKAMRLMEDNEFQNRLSAIIYEAPPVRTIEDIYQNFSIDMNTRFKTVFRWEM